VLESVCDDRLCRWWEPSWRCHQQYVSPLFVQQLSRSTPNQCISILWICLQEKRSLTWSSMTAVCARASCLDAVLMTFCLPLYVYSAKNIVEHTVIVYKFETLSALCNTLFVVFWCNHCCRTMLCKRGLCRYAVSVTFVHSVKTNKHIFENVITIG